MCRGSRVGRFSEEAEGQSRWLKSVYKAEEKTIKDPNLSLLLFLLARDGFLWANPSHLANKTTTDIIGGVTGQNVIPHVPCEAFFQAGRFHALHRVLEVELPSKLSMFLLTSSIHTG